LSKTSTGYTGFSQEPLNEEPRLLQLIRWAFANPEKIAAMGFGVAAFGLAAFFLGNYKQDRLEKGRARQEDNIERTN
jgi:hypothetical protein